MWLECKLFLLLICLVNASKNENAEGKDAAEGKDTAEGKVTSEGKDTGEGKTLNDFIGLFTSLLNANGGLEGLLPAIEQSARYPAGYAPHPVNAQGYVQGAQYGFSQGQGAYGYGHGPGVLGSTEGGYGYGSGYGQAGYGPVAGTPGYGPGVYGQTGNPYRPVRPALPPGYPPPGYGPGPYPRPTQPGFLGALASIARHDDLRCVPRLLCEVASAGKVPRGSGPSLIPFANKDSLIALLTVLNFVDDSPAMVFGRAALLGYTARGDSRACLTAYPTCPRDTDQLVHYLNNHNGGFFRFFSGGPQYQQRIQTRPGLEAEYGYGALQTGQDEPQWASAGYVGYTGLGYGGAGYTGAGYGATGYTGAEYPGTGYLGVGYTEADYTGAGYTGTGSRPVSGSNSAPSWSSRPGKALLFEASRPGPGLDKLPPRAPPPAFFPTDQSLKFRDYRHVKFPTSNHITTYSHKMTFPHFRTNSQQEELEQFTSELQMSQ